MESKGVKSGGEEPERETLAAGKDEVSLPKVSNSHCEPLARSRTLVQFQSIDYLQLRTTQKLCPLY